VFIGVGGSLDTISGAGRKAPPWFMENGMDWFYRIITRPWRIGRLLRVILFFITVTIKGLFRK
jgi:N-acetylglucosaminyldiphosphoundecaprenol N-acetyl-beta-D-mannosaminyltransferase